mmetsp:Transcript_16856/g.38871  ORF Transcript_16856/g.38871 Transcript_16856/m.38871 type:complete len:205 (-) Transcript_16856:164-778(-)
MLHNHAIFKPPQVEKGCLDRTLFPLCHCQDKSSLPNDTMKLLVNETIPFLRNFLHVRLQGFHSITYIWIVLDILFGGKDSPNLIPMTRNHNRFQKVRHDFLVGSRLVQIADFGGAVRHGATRWIGSLQNGLQVDPVLSDFSLLIDTPHIEYGNGIDATKNGLTIGVGTVVYNNVTIFENTMRVPRDSCLLELGDAGNHSGSTSW